MESLLGRHTSFSSKCKTLIKASRTRIEVVKRRVDAKQRFLKEDLIKLLSDGHDIHAFQRADEYIAGKNLLSCYDFLEQSCDYVINQLSEMQKQGECPEECREAIATLMFAAARFSDLPELRDLRDTFQQRYGNSLDVYVNKKFVEKLSSMTHPTTKKLKVLQDVATEFSIQWDSRGFKKRMVVPSVVPKIDVKKADLVRGARRDQDDHHTVEKQEAVNGKHSQTENKGTTKSKPSSSSKVKILDNDRVEYRRHSNRSKVESARNYDENPGKNGNGKSKSTRKEVEEEYVKPEDNVVPPPYSKPKEDKHLGDSSSTKVKTYGHDKERAHQVENITTHKPHSIRRKHHNPSSDHNIAGNFEDAGTAKPSSCSSRKKEPSRKGLEIWFGEKNHRKDEDEKVIDKLLIHYSKKPSSYDAEKALKKSSTNAPESSTKRTRNVHEAKSEVATPPRRSFSLPKEQTESQEHKKVFSRVNTLQPDNRARHVHPKLPDYDDIAAKFAALRSR